MSADLIAYPATDEFIFSMETKRHIFDACVKAVRNYMVAGVEPDCSCIELPRSERVNITLRGRGVLRASMSGDGDTLGSQLSNAVYRACLDDRFGALTMSDFNGLTVEVWIQLDSEPVPLEQRANEPTLVAGIYGVEARWGDAFAYYKPSVALTSKFANSSALLAGLCRKAGLFADAWRESPCEIRKTTWMHLCQDVHGHMVELEGMRRIRSEPLSREVLLTAVNAGATFLLSNQRADGSYCYLYDALENKGGNHKANTVRAAGCAYAMARAQQFVSGELEPGVTRSANRAIKALISRTAPWSGAGLIVYEEGDGELWGKLGSTALTAVALLVQGDDVHRSNVLPSLIHSLRSAQGSDGMFECYFGRNIDPGKAIDFFPGEALLALAISGEQGDEESFASCKRAFCGYRNHFRSSPSSAFVGWHVDVWSRLTRSLKMEEYAEFVFEQLDWILPYQLVSHIEAPLHGGFAIDGKRPNVSSTVYTEAAIRGAALAKDLGFTERWRRYAASAQAGLQFCMQLQLTASEYSFFRHPHRALGGITSNLCSFEIRADHVQHMLTMAIEGLGCKELI